MARVIAYTRFETPVSDQFSQVFRVYSNDLYCGRLSLAIWVGGG